MMACVQSDWSEACTAYASPRAQTEFIAFGWSMPHLEYSHVEHVHLLCLCFRFCCSGVRAVQRTEYFCVYSGIAIHV
jgi:hypothetical protein